MFRRLFVPFVLGLVSFAPRAEAAISSCSEIELRNALNAGGVVSIECSSNIIQLTSPIVISKNATLLTTNSAMVLSGGNRTRLFVVNPGVEFRVVNVALFSGRQTETNLQDGGIPDTAGAAIYNNGGTVFLFNTTVSSHSVIGSTGRAGASGVDGKPGESGGDGAGAAIFNRGGTIYASNVVFTSNAATGGTGGDGGNGTAVLGGNGGDGGRGGSGGGGAIYSQGGALQIYNCVFTNNQAIGSLAGEPGSGSGALGFHGKPGEAGEGVGGAIATDATIAIINGTTFARNTTQGAHGNDGLNGLRNLKGDDGRAGGFAGGGAIFSTGHLRMTNCTLTANSVIAGNGGNGGVGASGSFGADGGDGGNGGAGTGGALDSSTEAIVVNCTFSANHATPGQGGSGGAGTGIGKEGSAGSVGTAFGGSINKTAGILLLANTLLVGSAPGNAGGLIGDRGGNISDDDSVLFPSGTSFIQTNPLLRPLAANGGPTPTMAIPENSLARDRAIVTFAPPVDQRGSNRFSLPDIGAFEFSSGPPIAPTNATVTATIGTNSSGLTISWPANATNLVLFATPTLPSADWVPVPAVPAVQGTNLVLTLSTSNQAQGFFRLGTTNSGTSLVPALLLIAPPD